MSGDEWIPMDATAAVARGDEDEQLVFFGHYYELDKTFDRWYEHVYEGLPLQSVPDWMPLPPLPEETGK